jgi:uncharacterized membrane protein
LENEQPNANVTPDDRSLAVDSYVLAAFTGVIGPMILYLLKKDSSRFVAFHSLQALFFEAVVWVIGYLGLQGYLPFFHAGASGVLGLLGLLDLAVCIIAGLAANRGELYEIPILGRFTKNQLV